MKKICNVILPIIHLFEFKLDDVILLERKSNDPYPLRIINKRRIINWSRKEKKEKKKQEKFRQISFPNEFTELTRNIIPPLSLETLFSFGMAPISPTFTNTGCGEVSRGEVIGDIRRRFNTTIFHYPPRAPCTRTPLGSVTTESAHVATVLCHVILTIE